MCKSRCTDVLSGEGRSLLPWLEQSHWCPPAPRDVGGRVGRRVFRVNRNCESSTLEQPCSAQPYHSAARTANSVCPLRSASSSASCAVPQEALCQRHHDRSCELWSCS